MAELYTSLQVSPKKKKRPLAADEATLSTPKKLRFAQPSPPASSPSSPAVSKTGLPVQLNRLFNLQNALQNALSHALATCAISPTPDSGHVKNVLNHLSISTYTGLSTTSFTISDLATLCWIWEWEGKALVNEAKAVKPADDEDDDNPFLDKPAVVQSSSEWTRGSMGFIITPSTQYSKADRTRVPAYGIGIEVEMDIDKDMGGGMAAVARWTGSADARRKEFRRKLQRWIELNKDVTPLPTIPEADLPDLSPPKLSALTRTLASCSPSAIPLSKLPLPTAPSSPSRSPTKRAGRDFAIPFPVFAGQSSPTKKSDILFPQTPSRHAALRQLPVTPSSRMTSPSKDSPAPPPPDSAAPSPAQTPSRRDALYERIRQRSLSRSPTKRPDLPGDTSVSRDQFLKMSQDALRRRCLLGRLPGIAESIWMLFSNPTTGSTSTPSGRKRRCLPASDVIAAVIKSSPVPISTAEANESIMMLSELCPFFLKRMEISGEEWLEMPATANTGISMVELTPTKPKTAPSPMVRSKEESAQELLTQSPRRVKREGGGLREVREIIRRELESQD